MRQNIGLAGAGPAGSAATALPVATVIKIWLFGHKIGYKSACITNKCHILIPNWRFSGSDILLVQAVGALTA